MKLVGRLTSVAPIELARRYRAAVQDPAVGRGLAAASKARALNVWCGVCAMPMGATAIFVGAAEFGSVFDRSKFMVLGGVGALMIVVGFTLWIGAMRMRRTSRQSPDRISAFLVTAAVAHGALCVPFIAMVGVLVVRTGFTFPVFVLPALAFLAIPGFGIFLNFGTHLRYSPVFRSIAPSGDH